ncbi:DUF4360 domain-containing protein [Streptomyces xantholiticus]|uniref:DUF4360 domain-containing protein n=1 Tax=Streptomyces xantholiticus TaxID=68285 RepID=UPI00167AE23B|nr:DUF4360 domain-containing protein [Streptomyces xantholiticus]
MFRTMFIGGATAALVAAFTPSSGTTAVMKSPAPPDKVPIDLVSVNGSGCRPGSATVAVAPDNTAFTITYSEYLAQVGKGAKPTDFRKNCQLGLNVYAPQGFTYAIAKADYRGFASLQNGASATQRASYYFQGMSRTSYRSHRFHGPLQNNWQVSDTTAIHALVHKPCGEERNFNINTELLVDGGRSDTTNTTSFMAMDSTDGSFTTKYHFAWKKCPAR